MKIAMFGASGFVGSNLAHHLSRDTAHEVRLFDLEERKLALRFENAAYSFEPLSIADGNPRVDEIVAESDLVVDLAAHVHPAMFLNRPLDVVQLNLFDCLTVVRACVRHRKRLLHFSTSEVYGKAHGSAEPFREDHTDLVLGPVGKTRWIYSCAKQLLDRMIHAHGEEHGLDYTLVRPFNFVGPLMDKFSRDWSRDDNPRVFANFMSSLVYDRPLQLVDGGRSRRCFTYIDDAVSALRAIIDAPEAMNRQVVNIGNPANETSIRDLAELMVRHYRRLCPGAPVPAIVDVPSATFYGEGYEDCDRRLPDISKLRAIGWSPRFGLDETIHRSMAYFVHNHARLVASLGE
ncbi:NAD-dependent epimerase/dehydratase family protein [Roseicyclus persicicus]|uniref:NAD-dependent epimerase/dehydratase family protein n=1 Tax=Roseicyclus persicicus TaxID=2650661 RepID=A0A7X6GX33_9RHOB|nr:NAD-dependent epimerase/dehydratase family protein [Roseibacterium persicicum]NKX44001.1 NAD-dependent epimerase/dehydratase family protein [Roseibacterium persicicum]